MITIYTVRISARSRTDRKNVERQMEIKKDGLKTENNHALGAREEPRMAVYPIIHQPPKALPPLHFCFFQHLLTTNPDRIEWSGQLSPTIHLGALWTQCLEQSWWDCLWLDPPWTSPLSTRTSRHSDSFFPEAICLLTGTRSQILNINWN